VNTAVTEMGEVWASRRHAYRALGVSHYPGAVPQPTPCASTGSSAESGAGVDGVRNQAPGNRSRLFRLVK